MRRHHSRFSKSASRPKAWMAPSNVWRPGTSPWDTGGFPLNEVRINDNTLNSFVVAQTAQQGTGTVNPDPLYAQRFTVLNIRGHITMSAFHNAGITNDPGRLFCQMGLMYGTVDSNGAVEVASPEVASDGDKSWLWFHQFVLGSNSAANTRDPTTMTKELNVKSRRVLQNDEAIVLWVILHSEVTPTNTNLGVALMVPNLRVLYSKGV